MQAHGAVTQRKNRRLANGRSGAPAVDPGFESALLTQMLTSGIIGSHTHNFLASDTWPSSNTETRPHFLLTPPTQPEDANASAAALRRDLLWLSACLSGPEALAMFDKASPTPTLHEPVSQPDIAGKGSESASWAFNVVDTEGETWDLRAENSCDYDLWASTLKGWQATARSSAVKPCTGYLMRKKVSVETVSPEPDHQQHST